MDRHHDARFPWGVRALLSALFAFSACRNPQSGTEDPTAGTAQGSDDGDGSSLTGASNSRRPGAGHTSNIDRVAISSDGGAVLTRDQIGGMRLWPALDGSVEPIVIPVQGPQQFSLQSREGGGYLVAAVDSAGGAKILGVDEDHTVVELGSLAPFQPLFGIYVLPGGERLLALFRDHSIRLLEPSAKQLFTFEESRFRPTSLRLADDGRTFAALITSSGSGGKMEIQRMKVFEGKEGEGPSIRRLGSPRLVESGNPMTETTAVMSPDATRFVALDKPAGNAWDMVVVDLTNDDPSTTVQVAMPSHLIPNLGFISSHEVLVSANDGTLSWLVDIEDGSQHPRTSAPQDFVNQGRAQAVGGGTQAAGHGTWLFVHDVEERSHHYLGYRSFQTQSVAVSPSGEWVAWAYMVGPVFVERLASGSGSGEEGSGERFEVPSEPNFGTIKVRFFDDDHVITVDGAGGIHLVRWRDAKRIDEAGIHGAIRALHFDPTRGLMLIERHTNDARIFEVSPEGFAGPYIVADQSFRAGLLTQGAKGHKDAIMWTLDSGNKLRHYTLDELRHDPSQEQVMAKGEAIAPGKVAPLAIDRDGRHYGVRWNGTTMELFVDSGRELVTQVSASGDISMIVPSPSGKRFVAIHQRGQNTSLSVHDTKTLDEHWSFSTGVFNNEVVWSPDGRYVAVAANTGAVVLDAETGEPVKRRCGIEFEALGAAPTTAFNSLNLRSMCEE